MKASTSLLFATLVISLTAVAPGLRGQTVPVVTTLYSFGALDDNQDNADGATPDAALIQGSDGNFYGTTSGGGGNGDGTVFKMTPAGVLTTLHQFTGTGTDGSDPEAALIQGRDGNFYGTTRNGGSSGTGTIFKMTPAGGFATVHSFAANGLEGWNPVAGLVEGKDGNFYGTASAGGSSTGDGTVFQVTPAGVLTTLHSFADTTADGSDPQAALALGSNGNFYGTTTYGGSGLGTVFQITSAGVSTTLYSFATGGADGAYPQAALVQGRDGSFYGTTTDTMGGSRPVGTVFRITSMGVFTTLHTFPGSGTDGANPFAALIQGSDGNFYGTTSQEGEGDSAVGTVFRMTPAGVLTTLHSFMYSFTGDGGNAPHAALIQGSDKSFYGTTSEGGSNSTGTVFKLTLPPPVIMSATNATGTVGKAFSYQITATNNPTRYGVKGLPKGLAVNAKTGLLSGTPAASGTFKLTLQAANAFGTGEETLTLAIYAAAPPQITSADTATAAAGKAFSYRITATNGPTRFGVAGLPAGLHVDAATGLLSGTPTASGTRTLTLQAANSFGTGEKTLTLDILGPPVVTSARTATAQVGVAFSYQIAATNEPTSYGVGGLRAELSVDGSTGVVSGTPTGAGDFTLTLRAANAAGTGSQSLTLTIRPSAPVITSADTASATVGKAFTYQIKATGSPTSYGAGGLFAGITSNKETGLISGTPTSAGTHTLTLQAANAGGTGTETLTLTVTN